MVQVERDFSYHAKLPVNRIPKSDTSETYAMKLRFEGESESKDVLIQSIFTAIFEDLR